MSPGRTIFGLFAFMLLFLSGCATSEKDWYASGTSKEQVRRALADCKFKAKLGENPLAGVNVGFAIGEGFRQRELVNNCMIAKGYVPAKEATKVSPQSQLVTPNQQTRNVELENQLKGHWVVFETQASEHLRNLHDSKNDSISFTFRSDNTFSAVNSGAPTDKGPPFSAAGVWAAYGNTIYLGPDSRSLEATPIVVQGSELIISDPSLGKMRLRKVSGDLK